jgi:hypothetical protein
MTSPTPPYQLDLFVNRIDELSIVNQQIQQIAQAHVQTSSVEPIINFWGVRGIGKTWLLYHLYDLYSYGSVTSSAPATATYPTLALLYSFSGQTTAPLLEHITSQLADNTIRQMASALTADEQNQLAHASATGNIDDLVVALLSLSQRFVPLILLDNTEQVSQADWGVIEPRLIEPLALSGQILIIVAGQRPIRFRRFEVRRRCLIPEKSHVRAFDLQYTRRQVSQRAPKISADVVFLHSMGNPHLTDILAQLMFKQVGGALVQPNVISVLRQGEAEMLADIPTNVVLEGVATDLRNILYHLAPLRQYRVEALRLMCQFLSAALSDSYCLRVLQTLGSYSEVVRWDRNLRAYTTDTTVRRIINQRQILEDPRAYATQHRRAHDMYQDWASQSPMVSEDFIVEMMFHLGSVFQATGDSNQLQVAASSVRNLANTHLTPTRLAHYRSMMLLDNEIINLFPSSLRYLL